MSVVTICRIQNLSKASDTQEKVKAGGIIFRKPFDFLTPPSHGKYAGRIFFRDQLGSVVE
jgi:hypothetical protein